MFVPLIGSSIEYLFEHLPEIQLDVPFAAPFIASFVGRAVQQKWITEKFLDEVTPLL
jgi:hypothetical protein